MKEKKIIIIGMGTASSGAASAVNHTNPRAEVSIIEKRGYEMYSPCGMPFAFEGRLGFESLKHDFPVRGSKIKVYLNTEKAKIDLDKKEVVIKNQEGQKTFQYDSLIIATGARPIIPPIKNIEKFLGSYAHTLYSLEEVSLLYDTKSQASKVSIIGAGAIGVEFAIAMKKQGLKVIIAEMVGQVFPNTLDKDMAGHVQEYLERSGITVLTNSGVKKVIGKDKIEGIAIDEKTYKTDIILLACGTIPNIEWIRGFGIFYNKNGIITNNRMMTNIKGVYAAGECVETLNTVTKKRCRSALAVPARKQGRVAGINAAGGRAVYSGTLNTFISVLGDYAVGSTGITSEQAKEEGHELVIQKIKGQNKPDWYPGHKDLIVKLITDKKGKLLGGQVFGEKIAVKNRIDIISSYLSTKSNLTDMMKGELAYCPDIASIPDPLTTAIDFMLRRVKR
jgi:NADPH-dependent 2,4-dienoyl-CoA reductase/sulfur reductase-like enzyme